MGLAPIPLALEGLLRKWAPISPQPRRVVIKALPIQTRFAAAPTAADIISRAARSIAPSDPAALEAALERAAARRRQVTFAPLLPTMTPLESPFVTSDVFNGPEARS